MDKELNHKKKQPSFNIDVNSRFAGKTHSMINEIKANIEQGSKVGVAGCKDPQPILERLKALGTIAMADPMVATQPLRAVYETDGFEEHIIGFTGGEEKQTGFIFYCN